MDAYIIGLLALFGALVFSVWGYYTKWVETQEEFEFNRTLVSVLPVLVLAFIAGYTNDFGSGAITIIGVISFGYTFASLQSKTTKVVRGK